MKNTDSNERDAAPTLTPLHSSLATESREEVTTWPFPPLASVALPDASVALLDTGFESSRAHSEQSLSSSRSVITDTDTDSSLSDTFVLSDGFGLSDGLSGGFVGNTELPPATSNVFSTLPSDSDLVNRATTPRSIVSEDDLFPANLITPIVVVSSSSEVVAASLTTEGVGRSGWDIRFSGLQPSLSTSVPPFLGSTKSSLFVTSDELLTIETSVSTEAASFTGDDKSVSSSFLETPTRPLTESSVSTSHDVLTSGTSVHSLGESSSVLNDASLSQPLGREARDFAPTFYNNSVRLVETETSFSTGRRVAETATFNSGDILLSSGHGEGVTATVASSSSSASTAVGLKAARGELGREVGASYRDWGVASDISILSTLTPAPTTPPAHLPHTYITTTSSTSPVSTVGDTPTTTLTALPFEATPTLSSATVQPIPILSSASLFQPTTPILPSASDQPTTPLLPSASLFQPTPIRTSRTFVPTLTLQATYVVSHPALSPLPTATTPLSDSERVGSVVVASVDANVKTRTGTQTPSALVDEGRSTSVAVSGGDVHATTVSTAEGVEGGLPAVTATHQHTSTTLTNLSGASDMASAGVTDSLQPVNGTAEDTTITNPPSTPSPPSPAPPLTPSAALHTPATAISSRVVTDNSATLISASFDYLPLDSGTTSLVGSSVSGGEEASFSLLSSAGVYDKNTESVSGSGVLSVTDSVLGVPDGSGDVSGEGEGTDTTATTVVVVPTVISPTPSSGVWCSESLVSSSAAGNGSAVSSGAGGEGVSTLVIVLPVCLVLLVVIGIIVVMSLLCFRRKKKKKGKKNRDDLWVEPVTLHVPPISLADIPASPPVPSLTYATVQNKTETDSGDDPLYLVVHEFLSQNDTQVSLTPGDVISVKEKADTGWWRGGVHGGDKMGWFPSTFVVPYTQEAVHALSPEGGTKTEQTPKPRISSFLIRKKQGNRSLRDNNSFSLGKITSQVTPSANVTRSASTLNPMAHTRLHPVAPVRMVHPSTSLTAEDFSTSVKDKYFKVLFSYKAAFRGEVSLKVGEVVRGRERDRNGWMLGCKVHNKEEGWFPAVYVDQIEGDFSLPEEKRETVDKMTSPLDHDVYGLLAVNRNKSPDQSWVAIEHRAVKAYRGEGNTHMSLKVGDVVSVVEALDTGWWLGCHGDQVGWFPGSFVELLEERSESTSDLDSAHLFPLHCTPSFNFHSDDTQSKRSSLVSSVDTSDLSDKKPSHSLSRESMLSSAEDGKPRPARRAPNPPPHGANVQQLNGSSAKQLNGNVSAGGTLSRNPRPMRPAPAPPINKNRTESVGSMDTLGTTGSVEGLGSIGRGVSPTMESLYGFSVTPRKQRKPRVVRIPKEKVGLDKISSCPAPTSTPPSLSSATSSATITGDSSPPLSSNAERNDGQKSLTDVSSVHDTQSETTHSDVSSDVDTSVHLPYKDYNGNTHDTLSANSSHDFSLTETHPYSEDSFQRASENERSQDSTNDVSDHRPRDVRSVHGHPISRDSMSDLLNEMKQLVPGLRDVADTTENGEIQPDPRNSRESSPDFVAIVETSPTLTVPSAMFPHTVSQSGQTEHSQTDHGHSDTIQDSHSHLKVEPGAPVSNPGEEPVVVHGSEKQLPDRSHDVAATQHLDSFPNPLMSKGRSPSSSPTPRYIPPPRELLDEAEESLVDDVSCDLPPPPKEHSPSSVQSSPPQPKATGYWRFSGADTTGQTPKQKPVKVTKVGPPVLPRTSSVREEGSDVVEAPTLDASGRVSKIVHQINRRTSLDERPTTPGSRKTSLQHDSSFDMNGGDSGLNRNNSSASSSEYRTSSPESLQNDKDIPPTSAQPLGDILTNGGPAFGLPTTRSSANRIHQYPRIAESSPERDLEEDVSRAEGSEEEERGSRESTPESGEEGGGQRKSSKKLRAPQPPPKSPPPSSRKSQKMTVVNTEASEC
ncbi:serine-rich adhesin for platelets-like [Littorina saxatilis]|uniref:serine-rich adhesin for platelets-like n=1 Tax=Littorina saxatilis TaxID=31220 RepID=UPI0038B58C08